MKQTVTGRIKTMKLPKGGYIPVKECTKETFDDGETLHEKENIPGSVIGVTVEMLAELELGRSPREVFSDCMKGAAMVNKLDVAKVLINDTKRVDFDSVTNVVKLAAFNTVVKAGPFFYRAVGDIDENTYENIVTMVKRIIRFIRNDGEVSCFGTPLVPEDSRHINVGEIDILTTSGLWDIKTSLATNHKYMLQVLVYYLLGKNDWKTSAEFEEVKRIGVFHPRRNTVFYLNVSDIPEEVISAVGGEVIGYE